MGELTGKVAVHAVIGAHDGGGFALFDADFKRQQLAFARGALADCDVDGVAAALLVVERIVLDVANDIRRLRSFDKLCNQRSRQYRIFTQILKGAAVARIARKINTPAERHVEYQCAQLTAD